MKLKYYQDGKGNVYELKTELEQIMINDIIELTDKKNKLQSIINELEKYIHNELVLDFYNDDMPCELIINKMEKMIKELKENK